ncbi:hypothetical protein VTH06DRAFT_3510 [Thermothelomyces fergusii]
MFLARLGRAALTPFDGPISPYDARVTEAYEAAVAEAGGWLLLKYASRDEVELLGQGNGGIVEIRNSIAQYEEKSPLYGFLRYRRRSVIIKYLPEDCSRLIQARVTVHFEAVCDRFSPHDTVFEISDAKELKDTKLSAACSLHAASGSTSSSTSSLRRRCLMEIAEEEEEEERKRQSVDKEEEHPESFAAHSETPVQPDADLASLPDASRFASEPELPNFTSAQRPSSPVSLDESSRRMSSQSSRTDFYPATTYPYSKPRVKIGPRPSADPAGRPRSSASGSAPRVSTVPAGIKSMSKGTRKARSQSQSQGEEGPETPSQERDEFAFQPIDPVPDAKPSECGSAQPHATSATEEAPADALATAQSPAKQNVMTPEKARLLKAMKLREQKMMSLQTTPDGPGTDVPSAQEDAELANEKQDVEAAADAPQRGGGPDKLGEKQTDHASLDTILDSHPSSPAATSDIGAFESSDSPTQRGISEDMAADGAAVEAAEEPASVARFSGPKSSDADPIGDEPDPLTQQIPIPVSKFSTQETRPPTGSVGQGPALIATDASDVDSWRVKESAPPVPEKDTVAGATDVGDEVEGNSTLQKLPEPARTNVDVQDGEKSRPVTSIADNDGVMDELQSATVQQATPATMSKSPVSPVFDADQINNL